MAFLADLRDFDLGVIAQPEPRASTHCGEINRLQNEILGEAPETQFELTARPHPLDIGRCKQAQLAMPIAGVCIALQSVSGAQDSLRHGMLAVPSAWARADRQDATRLGGFRGLDHVIRQPGTSIQRIRKSSPCACRRMPCARGNRAVLRLQRPLELPELGEDHAGHCTPGSHANLHPP